MCIDFDTVGYTSVNSWILLLDQAIEMLVVISCQLTCRQAGHNEVAIGPMKWTIIVMAVRSMQNTIELHTHSREAYNNNDDGR